MLIVEILNIILPVLYTLAVVCYGVSFFRKNIVKSKTACFIKRPVIISIIVLQFIYFALRSLEYHHAPITSSYEIMTLLAFSITITYFYIEMKTGIVDTGFFILVIAGILQIISSIFIKEITEINPVLKNWLLGFHVSFALIGYSAITIAGIYGFLYLMLYKNLKQNQLGAFYKRLPSLQLMEKLSYNALVFGCLFLAMTLIIGFIWLPKAIQDFSYADPKLVSTVVIWLIYTWVIISKRTGRMQSKTVMTIAFYGFIFAIFSVAIVNIFLTSFHRFY
jgi:ABC-type transport system involved in cytochrome c biogenesis permease subunit